jgi:hypothetical protein
MKNLNLKNGIFALMMLGGVVAFQGCNDECKDVTCLNAGTCDEETGECICAAGYEGADCGAAFNAKFVGDFVFTGSCSVSQALMDTIQISEIAGAPDSVLVTGLWRRPGISVRAHVDGLSLSFALQRLPGTVYQLESSSAQLSTDGNSVNIAFTVYSLFSTTPEETCSGTGVRMN